MKKEEIIKKLQKFANKYRIFFEENGEIGFGRGCVGFLSGDKYIAYNPHRSTIDSFEQIKELYSEKHYKVIPNHAYHKDDYFAVLTAEIGKLKALKELLEWAEGLEKLGIEIVEYETKATGMQVLFSGVVAHAIKIKSPNN